MERPMKCPACGKQLPSGMVFCPWDAHALEPAPLPEPRGDPLIEAQISEYVLKERIGAGGMGLVYRAVQPLIGKQVAIKVMKAEFAQADEVVKRLLVEARAVNAIQHRGIIDIFGFGQLPDGRPYVVMELLQGVSLDAFLRRRGRLEAEEAAKILDEMLAALGAAHRGGVIHRDLKPGNVFLEEEPDGSRAVKLLDFGIAKVAQSQTIGALTMSGHILGTPEYMAPEQIRGEPVEPTADLYAVGVIAFQLLTGRRPFIGEQMQVLFAQVEEEPPKLSSLVPDVPAELERIVLRLLAKRPAQRFQSAEAVRRELGTFLSGRKQELTSRAQETTELVNAPTLVLPTPPSRAGTTVTKQEGITPGPARSPIRLGFVAMGAVVVLLIAGVVGTKVFHQGSPPSSTAEAVRGEAPATSSGPLESLPPQETPKQEASVASVQPGLPPQEEGLTPAAGGVDSRDAPPKVSSHRTGTGSKTSSVRLPLAAGPSIQVPQGPPPAVSKPVDQNALRARLDDASVRLLMMDAKADVSPAMAQLAKIQDMAAKAANDEEWLKVEVLLDKWERSVLPKR